MNEWITLTSLSIVAAGFFVGIVVGLTGMGGGALMTPALIFLGIRELGLLVLTWMASRNNHSVSDALRSWDGQR